MIKTVHDPRTAKLFLAEFDTSRLSLKTFGFSESHAISLMVSLWDKCEVEYGPFRFQPCIDDINLTRVEPGFGYIDHDLKDMRSESMQPVGEVAYDTGEFQGAMLKRYEERRRKEI